ncbi:hypothetical protein ACJMK2_029133 [Sinanodonta woodiana]|uniref:Uncharacterized protein n=1 Tax=Sinanodonta woodiana TaxID=1069815 RepID=A0ABD3X990_SINWO
MSKFVCHGKGCPHKNPPDENPNDICFNIKGRNCTHADVKSEIDRLLPFSPGAKIMCIRFIPLALHLNVVQADNRWVITLNSKEARNRLAGTKIEINGVRVMLRRYDDILRLEYRKCHRTMSLLNMVISQTNNVNDNSIETAVEGTVSATSKIN